MSVHILYNHITETFKSTLTKKATKLIVIFYKLFDFLSQLVQIDFVKIIQIEFGKKLQKVHKKRLRN